MTPLTGRLAELTERLAEAVADSSAPMEPADRAGLAELLPLVQGHAEEQGLRLDDERLLAVAVHGLAFVRRVRDGEHLEPLGDQLYDEVPADRRAAARRLVDAYCAPRGFAAHDSEVLLFALHFEVAHAHAHGHNSQPARIAHTDTRSEGAEQ
jgi:hypothetical protein